MVEKKILIVDDEEFICDILGEALTNKGYEVRIATNAEEGLDILKKEDIPVIFLDLNLPGMNGIELCKHIREKKSRAVIYAVTGYSSLFGVSECKKVGFNDFFTKPVKLKVIFKAAKDAFDNINQSI
ncbi:MAG: response regulator [Candidatus Aminicenantes bacterium]|nr:response regulator [Candidatus Aminicenantes bacterium]